MALEPQEQELVNRLKAFARSYGIPVGVGILLAAVGTVGWNVYQGYELRQVEQATEAYQRFIQMSNAYDEAIVSLEAERLQQEAEQEAQRQQFLEQFQGNNSLLSENLPATDEWQDLSGLSFIENSTISGSGNIPLVGNQPNSGLNSQLEAGDIIPEERSNFLRFSMTQLADVMLQDYPTSAYSGFANTRVAALESMAGEYDTAILRLQNVLASASSTEVERVATLMLAEILTGAARYDEALSLINSNQFNNLAAAAVFEVRGDVYRGLADFERARAEYQTALEQGGNPLLINYKISTLPDTATN